MNFKYFFFFTFFIFCATFLKAQAQDNPEFQEYAKAQDSLMVVAYKQRDTKTYNKLLSEFLPKYAKLSKEDKANFSEYYTNSFYNLSCTYSLLNEKDKALDYLEKSIKAGYRNYAHIKVDTDLDNIRNEGRFKKLMLPLRETGDYLFILKKAWQYNYNEKRELPKFTYQSADNSNLVELRKTFNLDSIAGNANEVSKILNILHWVHNIIPHDGQHESGIKDINAYEILTTVCSKKIGVSCGELATVLNEFYLALGFKSRKVYCFPKDSLGIDYDSHVINMVYSNELKKWLWVDPTNDAYVMNEKGDLLSIEEVRERIINNKPLIVNPEANWNHKISTLKQDYLYNYMAKNLYLLLCPLSSEYDFETRMPKKTIEYMMLIPLDYFKKSLDKEESINKQNRFTVIKYKTNSPNVFWQKP